MDNEKSSLANDIQDLINKSIEVNKIFLSETSKLVRNITIPGEKKTSTVFQPNFFTEAFNAYAKMNIQHMKNMLDLGVSLVQKANAQSTTTAEQTQKTAEAAAPSFVLKGEAEAGNIILLNFLLDNIKQEAVLCTLVNTPYTLESDNLIQENFITTFSPQSFTLNTNAQQRINIDITIPPTAQPGIYSGNVQVQGFEPAYFLILLTVKETANKTTDNGRKTQAKSQQ